jgi:hypothetical protein
MNSPQRTWGGFEGTALPHRLNRIAPGTHFQMTREPGSWFPLFGALFRHIGKQPGSLTMFAAPQSLPRAVSEDEALDHLVHGSGRRKGNRLCSLSLTEIKIGLLRLRHTKAAMCAQPCCGLSVSRETAR